MRTTLLLLAAGELAVLLLLPAPANPDKPGVSGGIRTAAAQLRGAGPPIDLVQDYVGARALVGGGDAYPVLTRAYARVGLDWPAEHRSTHPPTAFVLVLPVAWLPWKAAAAVWAALMLAAIGATWWALGARWEVAAALATATLLWPPAAWSLGQLTPVWLLSIALAWRWRERAARAGAAVAVAALTKLLPTLCLAPFIFVRRFRAVGGFAAVTMYVLLLLVALRASAVDRYVSVARRVGRDQAARGENSALLWAFGHNYGVAGAILAALLVAAVLVTSVLRLDALDSIDAWSWLAWSWAAVALLPIAWIYSLLPLLPGLLYSLRRGGLVSRAFAAVAISVPFLVDPFGLPGGIRLAFATACAGLSLLALEYAPSLRRAVFREAR
jgi:Glycosyltransferase family 87